MNRRDDGRISSEHAPFAVEIRTVCVATQDWRGCREAAACEIGVYDAPVCCVIKGPVVRLAGEHLRQSMCAPLAPAQLAHRFR